MSEIKRYRLEECEERVYHHSLIQSPDGNFVSAADFDRLQQERDTLARRVREAFRAGFNAHPADGADTLATSWAWAFDDGVAADREPQAWEAWSTAPPVTGGPR